MPDLLPPDDRPRADLPLWASVLAMLGILVGAGLGTALGLDDGQTVLATVTCVVALPALGGAARRRLRGTRRRIDLDTGPVVAEQRAAG